MLGSAVLVWAGCQRKDEPAQSTFYQRRIGPILQQSCTDGPAKAGCHVTADDRGNALGNLSTESYEDVVRRRDLLVNYGPYGMPGMLLKVVPEFNLALTSWKSSKPLIVRTNIAHVGGSLIDITSSTFGQLQTWMENGAAENNARQADRTYEQGPCSTRIGLDSSFDPNVDPATPDFESFAANVNPVLGKSCAASNCHGSPANSLQLTCGDTPELVRWNYFAASDYVSVDPPSSELVRRPLAPASGGTFHEGGVVFSSTSDGDYRAVLQWATEKGGPSNAPSDPGFPFFTDRVQPMLVRRGCMMLGCHSSAMFHDYRLRGGSGGHFGLPATRKNYELSLEQLALESPDPHASRLIRKNLIPAPAGPGILHRGGSLLAEHPETCDPVASETGPLDEQSEYCVIVRWIEIEREARMAEREQFSSIVFVRRAAAPLPDTPQDYASYAPGSDVVRVPVTQEAATGDLTLGTEESLSALCGLDPSTTDARRPAVSWDGLLIAFAARRSAAEGFGIYVVDGAGCALEPQIAAAPMDDTGEPVPTNGELVHNFDPALSPDGRIVFASTRGNTLNSAAFLDYAGPQRTPADPSKLNANLYVLESGGVRQLTFLLNQELAPSFMRDGRVIFSAEKRQPGFYQLAGRRINLDGGDYHPLFGQRATIGYTQFSDVVELADKNLAAIVSERGAAHGAGALMIINRSIGVDQQSSSEADYVQDPAAISWPNPIFYQRSMRNLDPRATGLLSGTQGAYRSPSPLPDGDLLVSYAANVVALDDFSGNFDIVRVDVESGALTPVISGPEDELWPVAVYARPEQQVFRSRLDEANGATEVFDDPERRQVSDVTIVDAALLGSLVFQNTRTGRKLVDVRQPIEAVWESLPPSGATSFADADPSFVSTDQFGEVYVRRRLLGAPSTFEDGSASMRLRGGVPILLQVVTQLAGDEKPTSHLQREEMQFYPGEVSRQGFRRELFDGLCGGCHGSLSGLEYDVVVNPDILTQASSVEARDAKPADLQRPIGDDRGPD